MVAVRSWETSGDVAAEQGAGWPRAYAHEASYRVSTPVPYVRPARRPRYFWRRVAVLMAAGALGAVAMSAGQHLAAGAAVHPGAGLTCPPGQVPVPGPGGGTAGTGSCGTGYTARPGDTVWSVAVRFDRGADPRALEDELEAQLAGRVLQPGEVLVVPR